jgi:hypothetical protein
MECLRQSFCKFSRVLHSINIGTSFRSGKRMMFIHNFETHKVRGGKPWREPLSLWIQLFLVGRLDTSGTSGQ